MKSELGMPSLDSPVTYTPQIDVYDLYLTAALNFISVFHVKDDVKPRLSIMVGEAYRLADHLLDQRLVSRKDRKPYNI